MDHLFDGNHRRIVDHRVDFTKALEPAGHLVDAVQPFQGRFADTVSGHVKRGLGQGRLPGP